MKWDGIGGNGEQKWVWKWYSLDIECTFGSTFGASKIDLICLVVLD